VSDQASNYTNPLDEFRSYSYHFIMTVASTTEALRKQLEGVGGQKLYSLVQSLPLLGELNLGNEDVAYLVLDTRRFSQFSVTEFESEHVYGTGNPNNPTAQTSFARMKIIDTTGFNFFNYMMELLQVRVKSARASAFFLLNIIFIGHRTDGSTALVTSCYMPLLLQLMSAEYNSSGSTFELEFSEVEGGFGQNTRLWQLNHLATKVTAVTPPGKNSLADLVQAFEDQLNANSLSFYRNYQAEALLKPPGTTVAGKLVQYMINLPREWMGDNYKVTAAGYTKRLEQVFIAAGQTTSEAAQQAQAATAASGINVAKDSSVQISFSERMSITDALTKILEACDQVLAHAGADARARGTASTFKIVSSVTSDGGTYIVHFDVYPYVMPPPKPRAADGTRYQNHIFYSYIFTGKNSHIEDLRISYLPESAIALDTRVPLGSWRMAQVAGVGQRPDLVNKSSLRDQRSLDRFSTLRPNDPIFPTALTTAQQTNFAAQRDIEQYPPAVAQELIQRLQEYKSTVAFFHMTSSIDLELTIRGNPNLLKKYADRQQRGGMPPHTAGFNFDPASASQLGDFAQRVAAAFNAARAQYRQLYYEPRVAAAWRGQVISPIELGRDPLLDNELDVAAYPIYVQLDIRSPNTNWDGEFIDRNNLFTSTQFFGGPYHVLFIKHSFIEGEFKQVLSLVPHPDVPTGVPEARQGAGSQGQKVVR